jgi:hypothetical protein
MMKIILCFVSIGEVDKFETSWHCPASVARFHQGGGFRPGDAEPFIGRQVRSATF